MQWLSPEATKFLDLTPWHCLARAILLFYVNLTTAVLMDPGQGVVAGHSLHSFERF